MSSRSIKRLVAAGLVAGGLAAGAPALASMGSSTDGAPGQQAASPGRATPGTGTATCSGGAHRRSLVKGSDAALSWSGGAQLVTQQITTSPAQAYETLVVTFSGEAYAQATLAYIKADIEVDGVIGRPLRSRQPQRVQVGRQLRQHVADPVRARPGRRAPGAGQADDRGHRVRLGRRLHAAHRPAGLTAEAPTGRSPAVPNASPKPEDPSRTGRVLRRARTTPGRAGRSVASPG